MRTQQHERADRIRATQRKWFSPILGQRFRNEEKSPEPIGQAQRRRRPECETWIGIAQQSSNSWPESESKTKRNPDHAERAGAFFFRRNVRDVSHRGWNTRGGDTGNNSAEKKPADRWRERHHYVVEAESEARQ